MSEQEYREQADTLLVLMQTDAISYQEYTRRQRELVDRFYSSRSDTSQESRHVQR